MCTAIAADMSCSGAATYKLAALNVTSDRWFKEGSVPVLAMVIAVSAFRFDRGGLDCRILRISKARVGIARLVVHWCP